MLHLIFQSPITEAVIARIDAQDDVLFMENAVLWLLKKGNLNKTLTSLLTYSQLYVLADDLAARGINPQQLADGIIVIDYGAFVALAVKNTHSLTWT